VMKEPDREPTSQSWMWVQTGGPPNQPVILCYYSTSRAQEVPSRLPEGYRGYLMTDDYAGCNALGAQAGVERLGSGPMRDASLSRRKSATQGQNRACPYSPESNQLAVRYRARFKRSRR
jgi:hypothetical protein